MAVRKPLTLIDGVVSELPTGDTVTGASGSSFQKYAVAIAETYTIPFGISSVVSGPLDNEGTLEIIGRLEIL